MLLKCWVDVVVGYLCEYGLKVDLFVVNGYGEVNLVVLNDMVEGWVCNCCVEILL